MQLALPASYVEIEQEEMMYLDGGFDVKTFLYGFVAGSISAIAKKTITRSVIGQVVNRASWWLAAQINTTLLAIGMNPALGVSLAATVVGSIYALGKGAGYW